MTPEIMVELGRQEIKTMDDFAGLSRDEFAEMMPSSNKKEEDIDQMIMAARIACGWMEEEKGEV